MFASMYYQLKGSLIKIVGFVLQFVVVTIRSCQINHQYQRDVLLADFGKFGKIGVLQTVIIVSSSYRRYTAAH